jgi:formylglycine-generating enzyme required for sulfatase activity
MSQVVCAVLMLSVLPIMVQAEQGHRYALLLGESDYLHLPTLPHVKTQMEAMRAALAGAGFEISVVQNATLRQTVAEVVPSFGAKLHPGDVCFFYFSGYAIQFQQDNYLLPVDFDPQSVEDVSLRGYSLTGLQQTIESRKPGVKFFVLDALSDAKLRPFGIGLANPDSSEVSEILFAFPSPPNQALPVQQETKNALLTQSLAKTIPKPGLNVADIFHTVQGLVAADSGRTQQVFYLPNVTSDFYFHDPIASAPVAIISPAPQINRIDRQEYVLIAAGSFNMGCVPSDNKCHAWEKPQHEVTLTHSFWMGRTETTVTAYQHYVDEDKKTRQMPPKPYWEKKERVFLDHPITEVTWEEASAFCEWTGGRLPTEAEWEYAARGGRADQINSSLEDSRDKANFEGTSGNDTYLYTAPVKSFDPNEFDLYDMSGNVWEWCKDGFSKNYFVLSPTTDPQGPAEFKDHVVRGGSWASDRKEYLRISYRTSMTRSNKVGFRCVLNDAKNLPGFRRSGQKVNTK